MRPIAFAVLGLPLMLSACAVTPRQQCEASYQVQLRTVLDDLRETETRLRNGYRLVPVDDAFPAQSCTDQMAATDGRCLQNELPQLYFRKPINRVAESAKRDALLGEEQRLQVELARCAVQFPE